jgi:release factor glutamine methyltransferase
MLKINIYNLKTVIKNIDLPQLKILRIMMAKLKNITIEELFMNGDVELTQLQLDTFIQWIKDFINGKPLAKIIQQKQFWSLNFITTTDTLDPRPDSEIIIEQVLNYTKNLKNILDLGTGSGCLLITLLKHFNNTYGVGVDISNKALSVAKKNALKHKVIHRCKFIKSNWLKKINQTFDIIIANPPYIAKNYPLSDTVINYDPSIALFGGLDGLDQYRKILKDLKKACTQNTLCFFEIGFDQKNKINEMISSYGFSVIANHQDLAFNDRLVIFSLKST